MQQLGIKEGASVALCEHVEGKGCMCDAHLRSLPQPEEQTLHNWHTTQYDNHGLNMSCQEGKESRQKADKHKWKKYYYRTYMLVAYNFNSFI